MGQPDRDDPTDVDQRRASFVPRYVAERLARREPLREPEAATFPGALLLADIVGFTRNVERITESGPDGLDRVAEALQAYFSALADVVYAHGGDILNVAGDAFLCCWPAADRTGLADATRRAARAGREILAAVGAPAGEEHRFATRIGIGAGDVATAFAGGWQGDWKLIVTGDLMAEVAEAEHRAATGEVRLTPAAAALVAVQDELDEADAGQPRPSLRAELLEPLLPVPVRNRLARGDVDWVAELRTVTTVMASLKGVDHVERSPLEVGHEAIRAFQAAIERYEGWSHVVLDNKGVTALGVYGLPPLAHEDDAERAVLAAQRIAADLGELGMPFGIGLARGRAFCGAFGNDHRREYTVHGNVMNLSARLMAASHDEVLVDDAVAAAVGTRFHLEHRPPILVKGRSEPVRPSVPGPARVGAETATQTTVIGRRAELDRFEAHLIRARSDGAGAVLVVEGEAGIGKSALVAVAIDRARAAGRRVVVAQASSVERATGYFAWRPVFAELATESLLAEVTRSHPELERVIPLLGAVVADAPPENDFTAQLQGDVRAENTRRLLTAVLQVAAQQDALLLVVEDAHWLDTTSRALLAEVVEHVEELTTVVATRPDGDAAPWASTTLRLDALGIEAVESLIAQRLSIDEVPPTLTDFVQRRAAGNPFYCVELVETMREGGVVQVVDGVCRHVDLDAVDIPSSVEGVVVSRIDRLSEEQSFALKLAAVVGRTFQTDTIREIHPVADRRGDVDHHLAALAQLGLTVAIPDRVGAYSFSHDITREVTYGLLPLTQRRPLHLAVADWYEAALSDLDPHVAVLAEHCRRAGSAERAVGYFERAGTLALRSGAFTEAGGFFERSLELDAGEDRARRATWTKGIGTAHYFLGDLTASRRCYEDAVAELDRPVPTAGSALTMGLAANVARQAAHRFFPGRYAGRRADRAEHLDAAVDCYRTLGQIYFLDGEPPPALIYLTLAGLNVGEEAGPSPALARILINAGVGAGLVNMNKLAQQYADRAIEMAEAEASPYVWSIYAILLANWGQWDPARTANDTALKLVFEVGDYNLEAEVWQTRGALEVCAGDLRAAETAWQNTRRLGLAAGNDQMYSWSLLDEVETSVGLGDVARAGDALTEALAIPTAPNDGSTEIEKHYATAATRFREGRHQEADAAADRAVAMVAAQLPSAFPWPDFAAGATEIQIAIAASGSPYGRTNRRELLAKAAHGTKVTAKVSRQFRNVRSRRRLLEGLLAVQEGRSEDAATAFARATEIADAMHLPYDRARADLETARLGRLGEHERTAALDRAAASFEALGALDQLRQVETLR